MPTPELGFFKRAARTLTVPLVASGSLAVLPEKAVEADLFDQSCVAIGYSPDAILNDGDTSTRLEVMIQAACQAGLTGIDNIFTNNLFTLDGRSPKDGGPFLTQLSSAGNGVFRSGEIKYDPTSSATPHRYEDVVGLYMESPMHTAKLTLHYSSGESRTFRTPALFILDKAVPLDTPLNRTEKIQTNSSVINIIDNQWVASRTLRGVSNYKMLGVITHAIFDLAPQTDPYHFFTLTSSKDFFVKDNINSIDHTDNEVGGTFVSFRRDITGIAPSTLSHPETDVSELFGSKGELRGISFLREAHSSLDSMHERTRWVAPFLIDFGITTPQAWWIDGMSQGGVLFGTRWLRNTDGTYTSFGPAALLKNSVSRLEQYLWGFRTAEEVEPIGVVFNQNQKYWLPGTIIRPDRVITMQEIIAKYGPRMPGPATALRHLKEGYIFTTDGRLATPIEMTARKLLVNYLAKRWNEATEGQSMMEFVVPKEAPKILEAYAGRTLDSLANRIKFQPLPGAKWAHWQVVPALHDGPGVNLLIGDSTMIQKGQFDVPAPVFGQGSYIMLPGQGYTERLRLSDKDNPDINRDEDWSGWAVDTFRTPAPTSEGISLVNPNGFEIDNTTPTLTWNDTRQDNFYYEVQLSADPNFNTDPKTATKVVYWNLVHGGVSNPLRSWTVPSSFPLELGETYYYKVRPRVQGDGKPVEWSTIASFKTSADATP